MVAILPLLLFLLLKHVTDGGASDGGNSLWGPGCGSSGSSERSGAKDEVLGTAATNLGAGSLLDITGVSSRVVSGVLGLKGKVSNNAR